MYYVPTSDLVNSAKSKQASNEVRAKFGDHLIPEEVEEYIRIVDAMPGPEELTESMKQPNFSVRFEFISVRLDTI